MAGSALERAREALRANVLPGDVVAGVIAASGLDQIPSSELLLAEIFYEFSESKPHLFEDFDFFPGGTYPFTDVLQEQLAYFETQHFLGKPNPTYRYHLVKLDDPDVTEWLDTWVFKKLERRGWLKDVRELGAQLRARVGRLDKPREDEGTEQASTGP